MDYGTRVNWVTFKGWLDSGVSFKEIVLQGSLRLIAIDGDSRIHTIIHTDGDMPTEYSDYQTNYESKKNQVINDTDEEGRRIQRVAAAKKGWTYIAHFFEFETSKDDSLFCEDWEGNNDSSISIKFYNSSNVEIVDEGVYLTLQENLDNTCVKTEVLFKPSFDYELISGSIRLDVESSEDCRLWVIGGIIELGNAGIKEFARSMNLNYLGVNEIIETDGRASKYMAKDVTGVPYQGNQLKFIVKHSAGYKFKIMPNLEYFRG